MARAVRLYRILRPSGSVARWRDRRLYDVRKATCVFLRDLIPAGNLVLQNLDLHKQDRRL